MTSVTFGGGQVAAQYGVQAGLGGGRHGRHQDPVEVVAGTLRLAADDIRARLQQGKSLDDVAQDQGVPHEELIAAIKSGMPERLRDSDRADQVAERIATRKGPMGPPAGPGGARGPGGPGGPGGARGPGGPDGPGGPRPDGDGDGDDGGPATGVLGKVMTQSQQQTLDSLASLLDVSQDDLVQQLRSGTSLAELVQSKGVSSSSLASVLQNGLLVDTRA